METTTKNNFKRTNIVSYIKRHVKLLASAFEWKPKGGYFTDYRFFLDGLAKGALWFASRSEMFRNKKLSHRLHGNKIPSRSRRFDRIAGLSNREIRRGSWRLYKQRKRQKSIGPNEIIVFDLTGFELPESFSGGYWYWKKVKGEEKYIYGIQAVVVAVVDPSGDCLTLAVEMVKAGEGELAAAKRMLRWLEKLYQKNRWKLPPIVCDRGYIDGDFIKRADAISLGFVGKPRCDLDFLVNGLGILEMVWDNPKLVSQYDRGSITFKRKTTEAKTFHLWEVADLESWDRLGLNLRLIVSVNEHDPADTEYFFTTGHQFNIPAAMVFLCYKWRWHIECWFEQTKHISGKTPDSWDAGTLLIIYHLQCLGYLLFKLYLKFRRVGLDTCVLYEEARHFLLEVMFDLRLHPGEQTAIPP
ncbi:MAG: transposase [bacterium]|nr:transposase [bacterium]